MIDILNILLLYINMQAALVGVVAVQTYKYLIPPGKTMQSSPGNMYDRFLPFIGPAAAMVTCIALEWNLTHPPDGSARLMTQDFVRGLLSGLASEFLLRIYYKTLIGI